MLNPEQINFRMAFKAKGVLIVVIPDKPKIYHIVHIDRLPSILECGCLWCDAEVIKQNLPGTTVGMDKIKHRRLYELSLTSHPGLFVGDCVPFYFCPRSIMLYIFHVGNHPELTYQGGQNLIVHLESDLFDVISWADNNNRKWAFTNSNAGARYFEDFCSINDLNKINWNAVRATYWQDFREKKQAEFLLEHSFPFELITKIGVINEKIKQRVQLIMTSHNPQPLIEVKRDWYY